MKTISHLGLRFPVYLWLVGIYPILYLYAGNFGSVDDQEVFAALIAMLAATTVAFGLSNRLMRSMHKSAFILGLCSAVFSLSGHVYELVFMPRSLGVWTLGGLLLLAAIAAALYRVRSKTFFVHVTNVLNLILTCMVLLQVFSIVSSHSSQSRYADKIAALIAQHKPAANVEKVNDSPSRPDIYFIVPDGYPSDAFQLRTTGYDNSAFTQALRARGFTVVDHAQANYGLTRLSLPATLNMRYYGSNPSEINDHVYLRLQVVNSAVAQYLLDLGYTYLHLMNGWQPQSAIADINREFAPRGATDFRITLGDEGAGGARAIETRQLTGGAKQPFFPLYIDTTLLRLAASLLSRVWQFVDDAAPYNWRSGELFQATVDEVEHIAAMPEATFTFIHFLKPHLPVVFNARGDILPRRNRRPSPAEFHAEFAYVNTRLLQMFDTILQRSAHPPIIIFLADHGSIYGYGRAPSDGKFDWNTIGEGRFTLFDVYAAFYLPPAAPFTLELSQTFTSVNTFALILNAVFGAEFELQDDRLFELPAGYDDLFYQVDVTDEFKNWR